MGVEQGKSVARYKGGPAYKTPQGAPTRMTRTSPQGHTPDNPIFLPDDEPPTISTAPASSSANARVAQTSHQISPPTGELAKRPSQAYSVPSSSRTVTLPPAPTPAKRPSEPHSCSSSERPGKKCKTQSSEKRLRKFRPQAPQAFHDVYARALGQRFYVLSRRRVGTEECPEEVVEMTGSTGNIYTVHIGKKPDCNCPHAKKGNQCKHVLYVMKRVLNAPYELVYQLALLSSELRDIFGKAPPIDSPKEAESNKCKPIDGDCPICFCELDPKSPESIVWCRAACGQNMHQECFAMWARTKEGSVTCPFCRSPWQGDGDPSKVRKDKGVDKDGYVNVADQLGISRVRDESTYSEWYQGSQPWYE